MWEAVSRFGLKSDNSYTMTWKSFLYEKSIFIYTILVIIRRYFCFHVNFFHYQAFYIFKCQTLVTLKWFKVFKNRPCEIFGRQPFKNFK